MLRRRHSYPKARRGHWSCACRKGEKERERYQTGNPAPRKLDAVAIAVQDSRLAATTARRRLGRPCRRGGRMIPKSTSAPIDRNRPRGAGHQQTKPYKGSAAMLWTDRLDQVNRPSGARCADHLGGGHSGEDDLVMPVAADAAARDSEVLEVRARDARWRRMRRGPMWVEWTGGRGLDWTRWSARIPPSTVAMHDAPKNQGRKVPVPAVPDRL